MNDISQYSGTILAYIGDAVIELYMRKKLIKEGISDTGKLSTAAQKQICAPTQSRLMEKILPLLTEEELNVYKRGRNTHTSSKPKNATAVEYHRATGMEALFGYLHLRGREERVCELFQAAYEDGQ